MADRQRPAHAQSSTGEKATRRRLLEKERQRQMRIRKKAFYSSLVQELATLETALRTSNATRKPVDVMLSWRDVAQALEESRVDSATANRRLKDRFHQVQLQVQELHAWVTAVPASLDATGPTWRDVTLLKSPSARELGKEWIVKRMYHHMDRVFHGFVASSSSREPVFDTSFRVVGDDGGYQFMVWFDAEVPLPMEILTNLHLHHACEIAGLDLTLAELRAGVMVPDDHKTTIVEASDSTMLHQSFRHHATGIEVAQVLVGVVLATDDRHVTVTTSLLDDEIMSRDDATLIHSQYQAWHEFQRVSPTATRLRLAAAAGPRCRNKVPIPLDEEAAVWGIHHSSDEATMHRHIHTTARRSVNDAMARIEQLAIRFIQRHACA
ncbi:Aste57867_1170 [Aphanomyces stellatus]|uniref:Aste57867_1170 protein n=1 Tax=Aphanomyces stellatus TaxID=120398 RepID=A0A485K7W3_9STRA|nr:hypothetical protein As57867_001169 [Aphanomyces stellatus]VFT78390.1 Aste57867_1170 [Aphanomyces stellatus]